MVLTKRTSWTFNCTVFEWGVEEECVKENFFLGGGHACGFLFNFSKVTENANNDKTIELFPHLP